MMTGTVRLAETGHRVEVPARDTGCAQAVQALAEQHDEPKVERDLRLVRDDEPKTEAPAEEKPLLPLEESLGMDALREALAHLTDEEILKHMF